ncbi:MAG: type II secretion system protein GspH [Phycisphaera sp.]|nr:type II secretion system protein GspH [Phycisphaera sp.]
MNRRAAGFTLIELIVVMLIIATTLAIAAPSLRGFARGQALDQAARSIVTLTDYARDMAISEGRPYRLTLDAERNTYRLTAQNGGVYETLGTDLGRTFEIPVSIDARWVTPVEGDVEGTITFDPGGRGDTAEIVLVAPGGYGVSIRNDSPAERFHIVQLTVNADTGVVIGEVQR